jgi:hypothetical protein
MGSIQANSGGAVRRQTTRHNPYRPKAKFKTSRAKTVEQAKPLNGRRSSRRFFAERQNENLLQDAEW